MYNTILTMINKHFAIKSIAALMMMALFFLSTSELQATHIVGGDLTYEALGNDTYVIKLRIRRDCENAAEEANFDDPATIGIFDQDGNWIRTQGLAGVINLKFRGATMIEDSLASECLLLQGDLCVEETVYMDTITSVFVTDEPLTLAYFRCCRNNILTNIVDPLETGALYKVTIDPEVNNDNTSAQFDNHTPLYVCLNEEWVFDHSATDADGDELRYSLYTPFKALSRDEPIIDGPFPSGVLNETVDFISPTYSEDNMLGGPNPLTIDENTGILSATPVVNGVFLIGVKVEEYRNGELINTVYRDMEIDVRACADIPTASFEVDEFNCDGFDVTFDNTSEGAIAYRWFFDFPNPDFTSDLEEPGTITYPEPGSYTVLLQAFADDSCRAESVMTIFVNDFDATPDYILDVESCETEIMASLTDNSTEGNEPIVDYEWIIETPDTIINGVGNPFNFSLPESTEATITQYIYDQYGCRQELINTEQLNLLNIEFNTDTDTLRACFGEPTQLITNGNPEFEYSWTPEEGLDDPTSSNPLATPDVNTTYTVTVSDGLCEVTDSIFVFVVIEEADIEAVVDTIDCDGNAVLVATNSEDADMEWSDDPNFDNIIGTDDTLLVTVDELETFYVRVIEGFFECIEVIDTIEVENPDVEPDINVDEENSGTVGDESGDTEDDPLTVCEGEPLKLVVEGDLSGEELTFVWSPEECILSGQGTNCITIDTENADCTEFSVFVENEFGCSNDTSFYIQYEPFPELEILDAAYESCGEGTVDFTSEVEDGVEIMWDFGDGNMSSEQNPTHVYEESGTYTVVLSSKGLCVSSDTVVVDVFVWNDVLPEMIEACFEESIKLNDGGDQDLEYMWAPAEKFDDPTDPCPTIVVTEDCDVTVQITDPENPFCTVFDTVRITVNDDIGLNVEGPFDLCEPEEVTLVASTSGPQDVTIEWFDENGNPIGEGNTINVTPEDTTCYTAVASDGVGCTDTSEHCINVVGDFEVEFEVMDSDDDGNTTFCVDEPGTVEVIDVDPDQDFEYVWGPAECIDGVIDTSLIDISPEESKTLFVTITDVVANCNVVREVEITVSDPACDLFAEPDTIIQGESSTLDADCPDNVTYEWTDGDGNPIEGDGPTIDVSPEVTTEYCVTTTDELGCTSTSCITVVVLVPSCDESNVLVPNFFTPNGDGDNDLCDVVVLEEFIDEFEFIIYNRYGEQVYQSTDVSDPGWGGDFNDASPTPYVYGYYLRVICINGAEYIQQGNITAIY